MWVCACVQVILVLLSAVKVREEVCITDQDRNKLHYETHHYNERLAHSREVTNWALLLIGFCDQEIAQDWL